MQPENRTWPTGDDDHSETAYNCGREFSSLQTQNVLHQTPARPLLSDSQRERETHTHTHTRTGNRALPQAGHRRTTGRDSSDTSPRMVLVEAGCMHRTYVQYVLGDMRVDSGIRSQADPPLRRAGRSCASQSSLNPRGTLFHSLARSDLPTYLNCEPLASQPRHADTAPRSRQWLARLGPASCPSANRLTLTLSDSLLLADAWSCGPICVQPGPGIPLRQLVPPDQRHIGRFLCQRHRITATVSG